MTYYDHTAKKELDDKIKEQTKKNFPKPSKTKFCFLDDYGSP